MTEKGLPGDLVDQYTYDVLTANSHIVKYIKEILNSNVLTSHETEGLNNTLARLRDSCGDDGRYYIRFKDVQSVHRHLMKLYLQEERDELHLCDMMLHCNCEPVLPKPPVLEPSPEYKARMERLRRKANEEEYRRMTKNVAFGSSPREESIGTELKKMDNYVMTMVNFLLTVLGAFAFAYKAVEYSMSTPNISVQLTAGVTVATIVFFADVYFLVKDLDKA